MSSEPQVWFAIPSASPQRCRRNLPAWREMGYRVAILQNRQRAEIPADMVVWSDTYPGWAESINILCREIVPRETPIVVSGGDDMLPEPGHSAPQLAEQFLEHFGDTPGGTFGVMQPQGDGFMDTSRYCGSPWLGRAWIERMYGGRGPMFGGYHHNWADNELLWVARGLGALWQRPDLSQHHAHFTRTGGEKPAWWRQHVEKHDLDDCKLYLSRLWARFPGHAPLGLDRAYEPPADLAEAAWLAERSLAHHDYYGQRRILWTEALRRALEHCADAGLSPVALYGSGTHTRTAGDALVEPPATVACIVDDEPARQGRSLWGFPVVSREAALALGVRAAILSANAHEETLLARCADFARAGVRVLRLYEEGPDRPGRPADVTASLIARLEPEGDPAHVAASA
jgi:hypothetical protein